MLNSEIFAKELNYINNEIFRKIIATFIDKVPDYFQEVPASSSGKYHPFYALGRGGLVRHTKAAVKIAKDLLSLDYNKNMFTQFYHDVIISSLIIHDCYKQGTDNNGSGHTEVLHPEICVEEFCSYIDNFSFDEDLNNSEIRKIVHFKLNVSACVESHMGQWNANGKLPVPQSYIAYFVHMCDYLASRKYLIVDVEAE